ncbi:MAG: nucleotide sugar dehydrogenase [Chloroflexi bacterium]|nr:nucleotide sugar dehydrogenase [Chloroflexota bacterium]
MTTIFDEAINRIEKRECVVAVMGLGYVGLPLALAFVDVGFHVVGIDTNEARVTSLNAGKSHVSDVSDNRVAAARTNRDARMASSLSTAGASNVQGQSQGTRVGYLEATSDFSALKKTDVVIVCVPTPLNKTKDPDMSAVIAAADGIAEHLHSGMLVILESTTYPGTTEEVVLPRLERMEYDGHAMKAGDDFFLAFSPERIDPGRKDFTVANTPKVIGGVTPQCLAVARALYSKAIEKTVTVSSSKAAEMVKLLENTFRAVNIGLVNEVAIMCDRLGIDVWEVVEAAKTKPFGFMPFYPGPGLGGHCIPIDPHYLAWKLQTLDYDARFIRLAAEINFEMPRYVVSRVARMLNTARKAVNGSKVLVLGVAYKADVGDIRESPSLDVITLLKEQGADVQYNDPHVPMFQTEALEMQSVELSESLLKEVDCVVITTAHRAYDWAWVIEHSQLILDTRNVAAGVSGASDRVFKL